MNNTKSSSSFLKSLRSKKSDTNIKNGSTKSKRNSRPLSASISSFNLNISLPILTSQKSFIEDNKENQNGVKTLRPRSSAPILAEHQSKNLHHKHYHVHHFLQNDIHHTILPVVKLAHKLFNHR